VHVNRILVIVEEREASHTRDALRNHPGDWRMSFVSSEARAIEVLAAGPFDMVIADVQAASTDGLALLARIKAEYPQTARVALSHAAEPDAVVRLLPVVHQVVAKPWEPGHLWKIVEQTCCLNGLMRNVAISRLLGGIDRLPSVPSSYTALTQAAAREDVDLGEIVAIVERDTPMSAKLLQLVNSAFFGRSHRTSSISGTVSLLGIERLKALALSTHAFGMLTAAETRAYGLEQLQERALLSAQLARRFLWASGRGEEGFTAGLLQNIGKLVLAVGLKDRYREIVELARQRQVPIEIVEREQFDVSHAEVGARLLSLWGLPVTIVEAIAFHHAPSGVLHDDTALVDAVHVADALVSEVLRDAGSGPRELELDPIVKCREGMDDKIHAWRAIAAEQYREMPA
jgi:HD-like signal output (HDOD) protein